MLATLALLVLPTAEPNEAEKLFREMEAKIMRARGGEFIFEWENRVGKDEPNKEKFKLLIADGNKARLERTKPDGKTECSMVADGAKLWKRVAIEIFKEEPRVVDAPKSLTNDLRAAMVRAGVAGVVVMHFDHFEAIKVEEQWEMSDFKLGKKETVGDKEARIIEYKLTLAVKSRRELLAEMSVWIDTATKLPLKRTGTLKEKEKVEKMTWTETYSKLDLNAKIDPKQFELPKK